MSSLGLVGTELSAPRRIASLVPLALSSALFFLSAPLRLLDLVLGTKRSAEVEIGSAGLRWKSIVYRGEMRVREVDSSIPWSRIERTVLRSSFSGLGAPLGLIAFALGTWLGLSTLADGLYAASPTLVVVGCTVIALGVLSDTVARFVMPARDAYVFEIITRDGMRFRVGSVSEQECSAFLGEIDSRLEARQESVTTESQRGIDASNA